MVPAVRFSRARGSRIPAVRGSRGAAPGPARPSRSSTHAPWGWVSPGVSCRTVSRPAPPHLLPTLPQVLEPPLLWWTPPPCPKPEAAGSRQLPGAARPALGPGRGCGQSRGPAGTPPPRAARAGAGCPRSRLSPRQRHRRGKGINIFCSTSHQKRLIRTCNFSGNITVKCRGAVGRQPREGGQISPQAQGEASLSIY